MPVIVAAVHLLLAVGALAARRTPHAGRKTPLWPLAPVVVIIALAYAVSQSAPVDLVITAGIVVAALGYEVLYLHPRRDTRFPVDAPHRHACLPVFPAAVSRGGRHRAGGSRQSASPVRAAHPIALP
jgi:hypothetical protein